VNLVGFIIRISKLLKEIVKGLTVGNIYVITVTVEVSGGIAAKRYLA